MSIFTIKHHSTNYSLLYNYISGNAVLSYGMHLYPMEQAHYTRPYAAKVPTGAALPSNSALQEMKESLLALSLINSAWLHQYPSELVCFSLHRWALYSHSQQQHKDRHKCPSISRGEEELYDLQMILQDDLLHE